MKRIDADRIKMEKRLLSLDKKPIDTLGVSFNSDTSLQIEFDGIVTKEDFFVLEKLYVQGYKYSDLASELGVAPSVIGMRAKRAKEKFRKKYKI